MGIPIYTGQKRVIVTRSKTGLIYYKYFKCGVPVLTKYIIKNISELINREGGKELLLKMFGNENAGKS